MKQPIAEQVLRGGARRQDVTLYDGQRTMMDVAPSSHSAKSVDIGVTPFGGDPTALRTRFRQMLTVLQQVHDCKRTVAQRIIAAECGTTWRYVMNLSTRGINVKVPRVVRMDGLARLEARYARSLRLLRAYESSCARERYHVGVWEVAA